MRTYWIWPFLLLPLLILTPDAAASSDSSREPHYLLASLERHGDAQILLASSRHGDRHRGGHGKLYRGHRHGDDIFFKGGHHFRSHDRHFRSHFRQDRHHFFRGHDHDRHFFRYGGYGRHDFKGRHFDRNFGVSVCVRTGSALICFNDSRRGHRY